MSTRVRQVAVVGGGWAGLATAVELTTLGHAVSVVEAATEPGGRARRLTFDGYTLDNGQHLLLGAYHATLDVMRTVGVDPTQVFQRQPLTLRLASAQTTFALRVPRYGGRAALAYALATIRGVGTADRVRALLHAPALRRIPTRDGPVADWLTACGQPPVLIERLWGPLCLAALNASPGDASARLFARVLQEAFANPRCSDLLLPRTDLGALFPRPAGDWLRERGQCMYTDTRVRSLTPADGGWRLDSGDTVFSDVVLATGPATAARLLPDDAASRDHGRRLRELGSAPIATVYLDYGADRQLDVPMTGRLDGPGQWVFDRRLTGSPGVLAVVISGRGPHEKLARSALAQAVIRQLAAALPGWPAPGVVGVVREKRATFDPRPGIESLRPGTDGPRPGLWYAGDHVDTGLPATIEGAVRSGRLCAAAIDNGRNRQ